MNDLESPYNKHWMGPNTGKTRATADQIFRRRDCFTENAKTLPIYTCVVDSGNHQPASAISQFYLSILRICLGNDAKRYIAIFRGFALLNVSYLHVSLIPSSSFNLFFFSISSLIDVFAQMPSICFPNQNLILYNSPLFDQFLFSDFLFCTTKCFCRSVALFQIKT